MLRAFHSRTFVCLTVCALLIVTDAIAAQKGKSRAKTEVKPQGGSVAASQAIEKLGGRVERLNGDAEQPVIAVIMPNVKLTAAQLKLLSEFPELHTLILRDSPFDNAALAQLGVLPKLQAIDLEYTLVNDTGLAPLRAFPQIKEIFLTGSAVTAAGAAALQKQLPETQVYWLPPLPKLTTAAAYFKLGEELNAKNERVQAIRAYNAAMQLDPKLSAAFLARGWTLLKEDEHALAKADFEMFVKLQPKSAVGLGGLALAQYLMGDIKGALSTAEKSLALDQDCADGLYVRGMIKYDKNDFQGALPDFQKAVELEPGDAANHERLGWTYFELHQLENSLEEFNAALKIDPNFEHAYYGRGLYWMALQKPAKAIDDLSKAAQLDPTFPDYTVDLALAHATKGDWTAAVATQKKVLGIASEEDQPAQQKRLKLYLAKQLPAASKTVESAAKPGASKK